MENDRLREFCRALIQLKASDLHLKPDRPPLFRINGQILPAKLAALSPDEIRGILESSLTERQLTELKEAHQVEFTMGLSKLGRFRFSVYFQRGTLAAAIRMIPYDVPKFEDLGIPDTVRKLASATRGLMLITGPTGSGKSTTLAALIQYVNSTAPLHILCIEDPIEFIHRDIMGTVTQREVGADSRSYEEALKASLRQDPDVLVLGELRDFSTISVALTAAETGRLVLATLHTNGAAATIERILDATPAPLKDSVRMQLSQVFVGCLSQRLVERADGKGRIAACEIMVGSPHVRDHIMANRIHELDQVIESSNDYYGMISMNQCLNKLVEQKLITKKLALATTDRASDLKMGWGGLVRGGKAS